LEGAQAAKLDLLERPEQPRPVEIVSWRLGSTSCAAAWRASIRGFLSKKRSKRPPRTGRCPSCGATGPLTA